jgi:predicted permease
MKTLRAWMSRARGTWPSARREQELAEEMESHLAMHVDDNLRGGMSPEEARRQAVLALGGVEATKEAWRDRAGLPFVDQSRQDLRFAGRQLAKHPAFAATATLVLALGTGASTAIFAFVDAALVRPLPYRDPARLVSVAESAGAPSRRTPLSHPDYLDWTRLNGVFESLDVFTGGGYLLSTPAGAEPVSGARVSAGFFGTLGVRPALGRDFLPGEDGPGAAEAVILSHGTWQRRFGGRGDVVGRTVYLSGVPYTIVGVLPREFQFAPRGRAEMWALLRGTDSCGQQRSCHNLEGIGRLKDVVSIGEADQAMKAIAGELERQYPDSNRGQGASIVALSEAIVGPIRPILLLLLGGAVLLFVIATVNVASLLLVRSEGRRHEIAVRGALGASRGRLARQFLTEGMALTAVSCALGLAMAAGAMRLLLRLIPSEALAGMPYLSGLGLNRHVLTFAGAISLLAAILFSLTPAWHARRAEGRSGLTEGTRGTVGRRRRFASGLVVVELALAVVLLVGAGLLVKSLQRLLDVELGFEPDHLATLTVVAPASSHATSARRVTLARELVARVRSLPGVQSAAVTSLLPVTYNGNTDWIRFVGRPYDGEHNEVNQRDVSADYFTTLRAKLVRGRTFTDAEDATKPRVTVINEALARRYFPDEDPLGKRFGDTSLSPGSIKEIVGIVADIHEAALDEEVWPTVYYPFNQDPDGSFSLVVRTSQPEASLLPTLRTAIRTVDPDLGMFDAATMAGRIDDSPAAYLQRSSAWLIGGFAALAVLLSVVGLYGVVAHSVSQRSREIALRMALGAERRSVYGLVLREAGGMAALGIGTGMAAAMVAGTLLRTMLFATSPWDVPTLAAAAAALAAAATLASYLPARRAASVDPMVVLRAE